jgi:DNA-binding NarL/FixJ family response regulator
MSDYTIILADDHTLFRQGIRKLIESIEGLKVIAEANDGHQLLALLKKKVPDLAILDISMPGIRGIEAAKEIHRLYPQVRILMLSMHKSREFVHVQGALHQP